MKRSLHYKTKDVRGFTLIEIIVAMAIVAALSVSGALSYTNVLKRSRDSKRIADIEQIRSALEMYRATNGYYPLSFGGWTPIDSNDTLGLVANGYISSIPLDPRSAQGWKYYYKALNLCGSNYCGYCLSIYLEGTLPTSPNTCIGETLPTVNGKQHNYARRHP